MQWDHTITPMLHAQNVSKYHNLNLHTMQILSNQMQTQTNEEASYIDQQTTLIQERRDIEIEDSNKEHVTCFTMVNKISKNTFAGHTMLIKLFKILVSILHRHLHAVVHLCSQTKVMQMSVIKK